MPSKATRQPIVRSESVANYGGACCSCGGQVGYWYIYRLCDHCLAPGLARRSAVVVVK